MLLVIVFAYVYGCPADSADRFCTPLHVVQHLVMSAVSPGTRICWPQCRFSTVPHDALLFHPITCCRLWQQVDLVVMLSQQLPLARHQAQLQVCHRAGFGSGYYNVLIINQ